MKKLLILSIISICSAQNISAITRLEMLAEFDKGTNFNECLNNCRQYHRKDLNIPHGSGHGMCWDICNKAHYKSR